MAEQGSTLAGQSKGLDSVFKRLCYSFNIGAQQAYALKAWSAAHTLLGSGGVFKRWDLREES